MKKILLFVMVLSLLLPNNIYAEWLKGEPAGTRSVSDIDDYVTDNNDALDLLMTHGRWGAAISYATVSTLTVAIGSVVCSNSA